jgi:hypothetical protein
MITRVDVVFGVDERGNHFFAPATPYGLNFLKETFGANLNESWGYYGGDGNHLVQRFVRAGLITSTLYRSVQLVPGMFLSMDTKRFPPGRIVPQIYKLNPKVNYIRIGNNG